MTHWKWLTNGPAWNAFRNLKKFGKKQILLSKRVIQVKIILNKWLILVFHL
jgi:hypothetical protein